MITVANLRDLVRIPVLQGALRLDDVLDQSVTCRPSYSYITILFKFGVVAFGLL